MQSIVKIDTENKFLNMSLEYNFNNLLGLFWYIAAREPSSQFGSMNLTEIVDVGKREFQQSILPN